MTVDFQKTCRTKPGQLTKKLKKNSNNKKEVHGKTSWNLAVGRN